MLPNIPVEVAGAPLVTGAGTTELLIGPDVVAISVDELTAGDDTPILEAMEDSVGAAPVLRVPVSMPDDELKGIVGTLLGAEVTDVMPAGVLDGTSGMPLDKEGVGAVLINDNDVDKPLESGTNEVDSVHVVEVLTGLPTVQVHWVVSVA